MPTDQENKKIVDIMHMPKFNSREKFNNYPLAGIEL